MRLYYSGGGGGLTSVPEALIAERKPHVMLTFYNISSNACLDRLNAYLERAYQGDIIKRKNKETELPSTKVNHPIHSASVFMDSGAFSLYGLHIIGETKEKMGKHGRPLDRVLRKRWGVGDYSYFTLDAGSEFRKYCDRYAKLMRRLQHTDVLFTTVDVIQNPQASWNVQQYFIKEHGLRPIPVIHSATPHGARWLAKYIESGHKMVGFGGLGQSVRKETYQSWANEMWRLACPASNGYKPIVKVHGFAMTSWDFMVAWPWWSVDSASWAKAAAYGWLYVPPWKKGIGFRHDVAPWLVNMSRKPSEKKNRFWWSVKSNHPRDVKNAHIDNIPQAGKEAVERWLDHLKIPLGAFEGKMMQEEGFGKHQTMDPNDFEVTEVGATSDYCTRAKANLLYFADFQSSVPAWPIRLSEEIVQERQKIQYRHGLGL
jgi:hypothetical protein